MRPTRSELLAEVARLRRELADAEETVRLAEFVLLAGGHPIPWAVNAARRATPAKW